MIDGWSAVCICLDVVYLGTVGCASVDVVEGDWAVDALGLAAVLCVSKDLAADVEPLGCSSSTGCHALTSIYPLVTPASIVRVCPCLKSWRCGGLTRLVVTL